jgi:dihydrofolate synthase/folylpolyglutamate synthase
LNKEQALQFLDDPRRYGADTDPVLLRAALKRLRSPETGYPVIHLAGTNGKGSTGAYLCRILSEHGEPAGHFTSPHVLDFLERIRINNRNIDPDLFCDAARFVKESLQDMPGFKDLRAFSLQMFTALVAFRNAGVRFAVIESGIGGRDDATNVLIPRVSVITPIGMDHMARLGNTVEEIAAHKAGIIKPGVPVFSAPQTPAAGRIITEAARVNNAPLHFLPESQIRIIRSDPGETAFIWENRLSLKTRMGGVYQAENAGLAIMVARHLVPDIAEEDLQEAVYETSMPGRRQVVAEDPVIVVDGAHNPHAIQAFCKERTKQSKETGIIGMMEDKETEAVLSLWRNCFHTLYLVPVQDTRSWHPVRVKSDYFLEDDHVVAFASLKEAVQKAKQSDTDAVYIMGSLYLAGEALTLFAEAETEAK